MQMAGFEWISQTGLSVASAQKFGQLAGVDWKIAVGTDHSLSLYTCPCEIQDKWQHAKDKKSSFCCSENNPNGNLEGLFANRILLIKGDHDVNFFKRLLSTFQMSLPHKQFTLFMGAGSKEEL